LEAELEETRVRLDSELNYRKKSDKTKKNVEKELKTYQKKLFDETSKSALTEENMSNLKKSVWISKTLSCFHVTAVLSC